MKIINVLVGLLIVAFAPSDQLRAQSSLSNGLVAYYPFNGNANDESGNTNNLSNFGATLCADRFGNINQAYNFNGSSYLGETNPPLTQIDNWTVTAWIQPSTLPQPAAYAVCVGYDNGNNGDGYAFGISGPSGMDSGNAFWTFFPGLGFELSTYQFPSTNQWYQIAMLRRSGSLEMYVNGEFTQNTGPTAYTPIEATSFEIGSGGSARYFQGAVDEVRIYNRALLTSEVLGLYNFELTNGTTNVTGGCTPRGATATATVDHGFVVVATVTDGGCGYSNTPSVLITGGGGTGATAIANVTNGVVTGITITDYGTGYTSAPDIIISPPDNCVRTATATATVDNGFVVAGTLTDEGCGYSNAPTVVITGGGGSGATAIAIVTNGVVTSIMIMTTGNGYTSAPDIIISPPAGCIPHTATATATVDNGFMVGATLTDLGCGYSNGASVVITGGGGTGATATAVVTNGEVVNIMITATGSGYTSAPYIAISPPDGCIPHSATGTLIVSNGMVISGTITDGGCGYASAPIVEIVGGGGTGATATAIFTNGEVVGVTITAPGSGYTSVPAVYFASPIASQISLLQAVVPSFSNLSIGENYQLQSSPDLITWKNEGSAFAATNSTMNSQQFFIVQSQIQLYFRLQGAP